MALTTYAANQIISGIFTNTNPNSGYAPAKIYLALSRANPNGNSANVDEPTSGTGYERLKIVERTVVSGNTYTVSTVFGSATNGQISNSQELVFKRAKGDWGNITYGCLYDAPTGGNLIAYGALTTPINPIANTIPIIEVGNLTISLT